MCARSSWQFIKAVPEVTARSTQYKKLYTAVHMMQYYDFNKYSIVGLQMWFRWPYWELHDDCPHIVYFTRETTAEIAMQSGTCYTLAVGIFVLGQEFATHLRRHLGLFIYVYKVFLYIKWQEKQNKTSPVRLCVCLSVRLSVNPSVRLLQHKLLP